jgi:transcription antitermination protein NusB
MISRRNIRVKVMQTIYTLETGGQTGSSEEMVKTLQKHFSQSKQLFVYLIYFITELAQYAEIHSRNRLGKHLPTEEDKNINTKLAGNELIEKILLDTSYREAIRAEKPHLLVNGEFVKKIYLEFIETPEYKKYIFIKEREKKSEKEIVEFIFNDMLLGNESFQSTAEDIFTNWDDDAEMMVQVIPGYLSKPHSYDLAELLSIEKWEFAKNLLLTTLEKKEMTMDIIKPKLKNWEADRIAILDMILMRMGVCEFLFFETIPPKVTINEYIDLAKEYSTPQSGHFVNGILDNIHKDLLQENKLHKVSHKT